jgi:hypothetical protein
MNMQDNHGETLNRQPDAPHGYVYGDCELCRQPDAMLQMVQACPLCVTSERPIRGPHRDGVARTAELVLIVVAAWALWLLPLMLYLLAE